MAPSSLSSAYAMTSTGAIARPLAQAPANAPSPRISWACAMGSSHSMHSVGVRGTQNQDEGWARQLLGPSFLAKLET